MPSMKRQLRHLDALFPSSSIVSKSRQQKTTTILQASQVQQVSNTIGDKMESMTITASSFNLLTSLPPELLIKIIVHLSPFYTIFFLNQVSRPIRQFIQAHAAAICNAVMQTHLSHRLALLDTKAMDNWRVPTHPEILKLEAKHETTARKAFGLPKTWKFPARISEPGPQFLFVLPFLFSMGKRERRDGVEKSGKSEKDQVRIRLDYKVYCLMNGLDEWFTHPTDPKPRRFALTWYFGAPEEKNGCFISLQS